MSSSLSVWKTIQPMLFFRCDNITMCNCFIRRRFFISIMLQRSAITVRQSYARCIFRTVVRCPEIEVKHRTCETTWDTYCLRCTYTVSSWSPSKQSIPPIHHLPVYFVWVDNSRFCLLQIQQPFYVVRETTCSFRSYSFLPATSHITNMQLSKEVMKFIENAEETVDCTMYEI